MNLINNHSKHHLYKNLLRLNSGSYTRVFSCIFTYEKTIMKSWFTWNEQHLEQFAVLFPFSLCYSPRRVCSINHELKGNKKGFFYMLLHTSRVVHFTDEPQRCVTKIKVIYLIDIVFSSGVLETTKNKSSCWYSGGFKPWPSRF